MLKLKASCELECPRVQPANLCCCCGVLSLNQRQNFNLPRVNFFVKGHYLYKESFAYRLFTFWYKSRIPQACPVVVVILSGAEGLDFVISFALHPVLSIVSICSHRPSSTIPDLSHHPWSTFSSIVKRIHVFGRKFGKYRKHKVLLAPCTSNVCLLVLCVFMYMLWHTWRSGNNLRELVLSFQHVDSRNHVWSLAFTS